MPRLIRQELERFERHRLWCRPAVHASLLVCGPGREHSREDYWAQYNRLLFDHDLFAIDLHGLPRGPLTTLEGEPAAVRHAPAASRGAPLRALVRLPREVAPGGEMIVRTRWTAEPGAAGATGLPPEDAPAAEPMARVIVLEIPRERTAIPTMPEPAETIDLADSRLLVFRQDLYRGEHWDAEINLFR